MDVRDTNFIWCEGRVTLIIEQMGKETLYVIHFDGKSSAEDEVIYKHSDRLAKHGTYTIRLEIPRWTTTKKKDGQLIQVMRNSMPNLFSLLVAQQKGEPIMDIIK